MSFSVRLRKALELRKMKPSVLAYKTGISEAAISHYLAGDYAPKSKKMHIIADALRVSPIWLSGFDVPMMETPNATEPTVDLSESEKLMIALMRQLPPESQEKAVALIEATLRATNLID